MTARAIVNPRSGGKRTAKRWPEVEAAMREVLPDLEVVRTEAQGDATRLAPLRMTTPAAAAGHVAEQRVAELDGLAGAG